MKRRQLLTAASAVMLSGLSAPGLANAGAGLAGYDGASAALIPLRMGRAIAPGRALEAVRIGPAFADPAGYGAGSLSVDLGIMVGREQVLVLAWQLTRRADGRVSLASQVTMPFIDGQVVDLHVTTRSSADGKGADIESTWQSALAPGVVYALATRRRSTGLPPEPSVLNWTAIKGLEVRDRFGHDFDAVLITTV